MKSRILLLICIFNAICLSNSFADDKLKPSAGKTDSDKRKITAYNLFLKSNQNFSKAITKITDKNKLCDKLLVIEKKLLEATSLVSEDSKSLTFTIVTSKAEQSGRWAEFRDVDIVVRKSYFPNKLIGKIRIRLGPVPVAVVSLKENGLNIIVKNYGKTVLENLKTSFVTGDRSYSKVLGNIEAGKSKTAIFKQLSEDNIEMMNSNSKILFQEKYNFVPPDIELNKNVIIQFKF